MADLAIDAVAKSQGRHAVLQDVSVTVASGALLAILGVSGAGKTTLLRLIAGFDMVDRGSIAIGGIIMAAANLHVPPERRRIGYVPQNGALFPHLTVAQNIGLGVPKAARDETVTRLLDRLGLTPDLARRMPAQLSGGQQQRVAVARALAPRPRLVLLDEPFSALDPGLRAETAAAVVAALTATDSTAVLVTHDRAEAFSLGTEVAVLRGGKIAQRGKPEELYRRPVDLGIAAFLGDANILPGIAWNGIARCVLGELPAEGPEGEVEILIRPEQVRLVSFGAGTCAIVAGVTYFGADAMVSLAVSPDVSLSTRVVGHELPRVGTQIALRIEGEVRLFKRG